MYKLNTMDQQWYDNCLVVDYNLVILYSMNDSY